MAHTNSTDNYGLPQWIGTDKPTFLGDFNSAFATIDTQMKANADAATTAVATANSADAVATSANTNATTALNTANSAATDAASAVSTASAANTTANTAATNASAALRASAANSIENLAPAYDPTLTYAVGDLVTYIDAQNSGKLYKCIVAVNTPMEFNINYWDDVTTSEVYGKKKKLIASVNTDGVKTIGELLGELVSDITFDLNKHYVFKEITATNSTTYNELSITSNTLMFTAFTASGSDITFITIKLSKENTQYFHTIKQTFADSSIVSTYITSNVPAVGNTLALYETE